MDDRLIKAIIVVSISVIVYLFLRTIINKRIKSISDDKTNNSKKRKTYLKISNSTLKYLLIIAIVIFILKIYGINVTSIVAGLGIISAIAGLALQDVLKDIIVGFNIIIDNYYSIGDLIEVDGIEGIVTEINFRFTKIKDIKNNNQVIIGNRNIIKSINISGQIDIDIPIPYEEKVDRIENILNNIIEESKENKNVKDIKYIGINEFGASSIIYKLRIWCIPELKYQVKRDLLRVIKLKLDKEKICIPYTQINIHQK